MSVSNVYYSTLRSKNQDPELSATPAGSRLQSTRTGKRPRRKGTNMPTEVDPM